MFTPQILIVKNRLAHRWIGNSGAHLFSFYTDSRSINKSMSFFKLQKNNYILHFFLQNSKFAPGARILNFEARPRPGLGFGQKHVMKQIVYTSWRKRVMKEIVYTSGQHFSNSVVKNSPH